MSTEQERGKMSAAENLSLAPSLIEAARLSGQSVEDFCQSYAAGVLANSKRSLESSFPQPFSDMAILGEQLFVRDQLSKLENEIIQLLEGDGDVEEELAKLEAEINRSKKQSYGPN